MYSFKIINCTCSEDLPRAILLFEMSSRVDNNSTCTFLVIWVWHIIDINNNNIIVVQSIGIGIWISRHLQLKYLGIRV